MSNADVLRALMDRARYEYKCNRGPRPSGALLVLEANPMNIEFVIGDVRPIGTLSCLDVGCMMEDGHCVRNNHAEVDALLRAARLGVSTLGATCFSINKPCYQCTRALAVAGIDKIVYGYAVYDEERTNRLIGAAHITVVEVRL